jgi:hypothetical protein
VILMVQELQEIVDQTLHWLANYAAFPTATYILARVATPVILKSKGSTDENIRDTVLAGSTATAAIALQAYYVVTPEIPKNLEAVAGYLGAVGAGAAGLGLVRAAETALKNKPADVIRNGFYEGTSKGAKYLPAGIAIFDIIASRI